MTHCASSPLSPGAELNTSALNESGVAKFDVGSVPTSPGPVRPLISNEPDTLAPSTIFPCSSIIALHTLIEPKVSICGQSTCPERRRSLS